MSCLSSGLSNSVTTSSVPWTSLIILELAFQLVHFYGRADTCVLYKSGKLSETKSYEKAETRGARKLHLGTKDGSAQTNKQKPIFTSNCSEDDLTFEAFGGSFKYCYMPRPRPR